MRKTSVVLALLLVLPAAAAGQMADKARLRGLADIPKVSCHFRFGYKWGAGCCLFYLFTEQPDVSADVAVLREGLRGDAGDAESYHRIGDLYNAAEQKDKAQEAFGRAVALFRQRAEANPNDGPLLARFGTALSAAGHDAEAETVLRKAVRVAPGEGRCHLALGQFLTQAQRFAEAETYLAQAVRLAGHEWPTWTARGDCWFGKGYFTLCGADRPRHLDLDDLPGILRWLEKHQPAAQQIFEAQHCLERAAASYNEAVTRNPREPEPYIRRAIFRVLYNGLGAALKQLAQGQPAAGRPQLITAEVVADLRKAVEHSPANYSLMGLTAFFEVLSLVARDDPRAVAPSALWQSVPAAKQAEVQKVLAQLGEAAANPGADPHAAADATVTLGALQLFLTRDKKAAEANLRQTVRLEPAREQGWLLLISLLADGERFQELKEVCQDCFHYHPSPRNRLLLAKAYSKLGAYAQAEEHVREVLKQNPGDFLAHLALANLYLRKEPMLVPPPPVPGMEGGAEDPLAKALEHVEQARQALQGMKAPPASFVLDFLATVGLYLALDDKPGPAREKVEAVLERDPGHETARGLAVELGVPLPRR
jgi:tetratricopeptide (TPR) repeat protein